jgi:long-chain acyl-CoA synthetase
VNTPDTLPRLLLRNATTMAARPAMREKRKGIWQADSWAAHAEQVLALARGLAAQGFARGDRLAVLGDNRPPLYRAMLAAQCLGGVAVPVWPDADNDWLAHVLGDAGVSVVVAEDQDQVEKLLGIKPLLPALRLIVYTDPRGVHHTDVPFLFSLPDVVARGAQHAADIAAEIAQGRAEDLVLLCYETGASGAARGVMLSHANLIAAATALAGAEDVRPTDEIFSYLPMAWIGDALYSTALGLLIGFTCNCPEDPETARRDLREIGPTILLAPPRIWESLLDEIEIKAAHATALKRHLCSHFLRLADRDEEPAASPEGALRRTPEGALRRTFAEVLVRGPLRDQIGLGRLRWAHTGGAALAPRVFGFFRSLGIALKQSFGSATCAGIATLPATGMADPDMRGQPCPGIALRIGNGGEVELRGPAVCLGYYGESRPAPGADGWWRTGDAGRIESSGDLVIAGRLADLGRLEDGTAFAPDRVEMALRGSPFIADAVAFGNERKFVAALIAINQVIAGDWAQGNSLAYSSTADLLALPELRQLIQGEIERCNARLPPALRVRRYALLETVPAAVDTEASLSRVLQRRFVHERHAGLAETLFLAVPGAGETPREAQEVAHA